MQLRCFSATTTIVSSVYAVWRRLTSVLTPSVCGEYNAALAADEHLLQQAQIDIWREQTVPYRLDEASKAHFFRLTQNL